MPDVTPEMIAAVQGAARYFAQRATTAAVWNPHEEAPARARATALLGVISVLYAHERAEQERDASAEEVARRLWKELHGWDPKEAIHCNWEGLHQMTRKEFEAIVTALTQARDAARAELAEAKAEIERLRIPASRAAGDLAQQLLDGANRAGVDDYTKTLLWHASGKLDQQNTDLAALRERHERALAVVESARAYNDSPNSLGRRDLALLHDLDTAIAAFDAADKAEGTDG